VIIIATSNSVYPRNRATTSPQWHNRHDNILEKEANQREQRNHGEARGEGKDEKAMTYRLP
jgi:hypothetical protein